MVSKAYSDRNLSESEINEAEQVISSPIEFLRVAAAKTLIHHCISKKQYEKAQEYLSLISDQDPDKQKYQIAIFEAKGNCEKTWESCENVLLCQYQESYALFNRLFSMSIQRKEMDLARYYTDKKKELISLYEMGEYNAWAAELELQQILKNRDETIACIKGMLQTIDSARAFAEAPLYGHLSFQSTPPGYEGMLRENLIRAFSQDEDFSYMEEDPRWQALLFGDM